MDLENYESDLADLTLQDSPFYEAATPMIFDLSMSAASGLNVTGVTVSGGKLSGKGASSSMNMISNNMVEHNGINGHVNVLQLGNVPAYGYVSSYDNGPPKKKNRKCVSFLPNYIQVSFWLLTLELENPSDRYIQIGISICFIWH